MFSNVFKWKDFQINLYESSCEIYLEVQVFLTDVLKQSVLYSVLCKKKGDLTFSL